MAGAAAEVSERMIEKIAVVGSEQETIKKVEDIEKAGATRVILFPIAIDGDYDRGVRALVDAFAH